MFEAIEDRPESKVAVLGIGRAGCSIISKLRNNLEDRVDFQYIHTQDNYLNDIASSNKICIGISETKDFGTNGEAYLGLKCAEKHKDQILKSLAPYDIIFIVAGLGGGTGSGATPYLAKLLKESDALVVSIVSLPFAFEGERKRRIALSSYQKIKSSGNSTIIIENEHILKSDKAITSNIFSLTDQYMSSTIRGLAGLVTQPGLINVEPDDLKTALGEMGSTISITGVGLSSGKARAMKATRLAITNASEFRDFDFSTSKSLIISITAGLDMGIHEFEEVGSIIRKVVPDDITVVVGTIIDPSVVDDLEVLITISGLEDNIIFPDTFHTEIFRSISFEPEHIQAGISILSYFGEVLKQKYSDIDAKIRIERQDDLVTLVIESELGVIEKIERTLDAYGDIVTGSLQASNLLDNRVDIERLEMKLEMSAMELRHSQKIINLYEKDRSSTENRINNLEKQVSVLHKLLGKSLKGSNKIATSSLALSHANTTLMEAHLENIKELLNKTPSEANSDELIRSINKIKDEDSSYLGAVRELFVNSAYGITGNSAYDFLINLINAVPK